jgi:hypothetical protein
LGTHHLYRRTTGAYTKLPPTITRNVAVLLGAPSLTV